MIVWRARMGKAQNQSTMIRQNRQNEKKKNGKKKKKKGKKTN